ncbi:TPA: 1-(5-phosphoribosyl)-5-[(5-phosphoribosylamino)methylideneamino]imidazole-4-carboxamide isomerase [Candidatus Poribacteria bacterium]|jgi:phosphoribosylformimino-5-aminoimidazole carboxamide ribotide isomerase|nr:1-(5-phosphoribosyl)-5-[(5-phosphoribosylamino)methylideneamino]imidazole-4-carboxamide isomerase [Candidatus Poribacteria bacterium]HIB87564.1 1-(5-phosphoribosyl)-5-[(5-phosphoribosylamino)methylideneamino]imidazole-4-carboxamide isomerase [Candidatus Poribacteria bacterium]HIB98533.1 1-(5-phosphoribosyl)-5-[(5-phosphoribosylamino)methylideneamino]imidazole-4-carboxamide isomerase [Candidatus Poribacteria bacterium]HIC19137.1 1-(5-phosphoribosyl)-5-[(5-phosphoribosylamino)methylideneamino]i
MIILPAIDLRHGKCVNLIQGHADEETIFSDYPVDVAKQWEQQGAEYLHLVDLDGAFQEPSQNLKIVKEIIDSISIPTQLGGGIRDIHQLNQVFEVGVSRAIIGTAALKNPDFLSFSGQEYGDQIAVGVDAEDGMVATEGWLDVSEKPALDFAVEIEKSGIKTIVYTDIKSDGMLKGPNLEATRTIINAVEIDVIASGGITFPDNITALRDIGASGAIIGRALYTGALSLSYVISAAIP